MDTPERIDIETTSEPTPDIRRARDFWFKHAEKFIVDPPSTSVILS